MSAEPSIVWPTGWNAEKLAETALAARAQAYAPYSKFQVGAALLLAAGRDGAPARTLPGCNVENASYGLCLCAERTAVVAAVAQGVAPAAWVAMAVVADTSQPVSPCGACRQFLIEFRGDLPLLMMNTTGARQWTTPAALLPGSFDPADLATATAAPETA